MGLFNLPPRRENNPARRVGPPSHIFNDLPAPGGGTVGAGAATHHLGRVVGNKNSLNGGIDVPQKWGSSTVGWTINKGQTKFTSGNSPVVPEQPAKGARMMDHDTAMARMQKGVPAAQEYTRRQANMTRSEKRASRRAVRRDVDALAKASRKRGK